MHALIIGSTSRRPERTRPASLLSTIPWLTEAGQVKTGRPVGRLPWRSAITNAPRASQSRQSRRDHPVNLGGRDVRLRPQDFPCVGLGLEKAGVQLIRAALGRAALGRSQVPRGANSA
jgi:hypothetical protein